MRETQSFNSTMELKSCDLLQFTAIYQKKELHSCDGMKLYFYASTNSFYRITYLL